MPVTHTKKVGTVMFTTGQHQLFFWLDFIILWELKLYILAVLQVDFSPVLGGYKTCSAQQFAVLLLWFSSSWCAIHFQQEADLDCRQPVKHTHSMPTKPRCCNSCRMRPFLCPAEIDMEFLGKVVILAAAYDSPKFPNKPPNQLEKHF